MVMVAFLRQSDFFLKAQNRRPVFAHGTIHIVGTIKDFMHPFHKGFNHLIMVVEISSFNKSGFGMTCRYLIGEPIDTVNQNA